MTAILCSEVSALFSCSSRFVTDKYTTIAEKLQDEFGPFGMNGQRSAVTIDGTGRVSYNSAVEGPDRPLTKERLRQRAGGGRERKRSVIRDEYRYSSADAGDGPDRERLEKLAEELGIKDQVVFTGMISPDKVAGYYKLGDVFVCASNSETQGITYIEALACGLPALCRRDDCLSQVVTDGYNGFQYENYAYFKIHLDYILEQEERRLEMGRRGQEISSLYSTWNFCTAAEGIYRKVIERQEKYRDGELSREEKNTETKNRWKEIPASWARVIMKRGA